MAFAAIKTITEVFGRYKLGVAAALSRHPKITKRNTVKWFPLGMLSNLYNTCLYNRYSEEDIFILRIFMKNKNKKPFLSNNEPKSVFDLFFWLEST